MASTRMEGVAEGSAPPEKVWRVLTDAARMPEWFSGAKDVQAFDGFPNVGGGLRWRVAGTRFEARVTRAEAPRLLHLDTQTPSARSIITHEIEALPNGGARLTKVVDAQWKGMMGPLFGKLIIGPSVKREARKVVEAAQR